MFATIRGPIIFPDDPTPARPSDVEVFLDGVRLHYCVAADTDAGWAQSIARHTDGRFKYDGDLGGLQHEIRHGKVEVRRKAA